MLQVSESSWKRQHKWDISSDPAAVRFFERLSDVMGRRGWVELWLATCGDRPIAFEFHLRYGGVTSPIRGDFDESYRSLSPGAYLEAEIIRRLFDDPERTCVEYNTCADAYPYECRWTAHIRPHDTAWIFAPSWYRAVLYPLALLRRPRKAARSNRALSCRPAEPVGAVRKSTGVRNAKPRQADRPREEAEEKKDMKRTESQSLMSRAKIVAKGAYAVAHDIPLAIRDEKNYFISKRKDALLILTWGCTSKCTACTVWRRPRRAEEELTLDEWIGVARKLVSRGIRVVELFGGDIFVRKDIVPPLAREFKSLGCKVHMPTNSNLMDQETAGALVDSLDVIYLSTDGTGELHDEVRGVKGTFGRLTNALDCFLKARGDKPTPYIVCNTTVSRFNCHALTDIATFAARAGYDEIRFEYVGQFNDDIISRSRIGDFTPSPIFVQEGPSCLLEEEHVSLFREQLRLSRRHTPRTASTGRPFTVVTLNADVLSDKDLVAGTIPGSRCFPERNSVVIDPYGNIVPCMFYDKYSTGNVRDGALDRSLETPERKRFRALRDNGKLDMCKHCILKVARNHEAVDTLKRAYLESVHAHEEVLPPLEVAKSRTNGRATNGARHIPLPVLGEPARGCSGP